MLSRLALLLLLCLPLLSAQQWRPLFNGKNLDGWQPRGECKWTVLPGGILLGQRTRLKPSEPFGQPWPVNRAQFASWLYRQAWLYTIAEYTEFDLHLEYFVPTGVNSGVSIRDVSRAHYAIGEAGANDPPLTTSLKGTPAHIGYEIQIIDDDSDRYPSGSVYTFVSAPAGLQKHDEWNSLDIESRSDSIRVKVNGRLAADYPGAAGRSKVGPIGIQLHDQFSFMLFRDIRIHELQRKP